MGTLNWVKALWGEKDITEKKEVVWHSDHCDLNAVNMDWRGICYCCPFDLWHKEKMQKDAASEAARSEAATSEAAASEAATSEAATSEAAASGVVGAEPLDKWCEACGSIMHTSSKDICFDCSHGCKADKNFIGTKDEYLLWLKNNNNDYDVQCKECNTWVPVKEIDGNDYCLDCQNPEYDPVWPLGL